MHDQASVLSTPMSTTRQANCCGLDLTAQKQGEHQQLAD